MFGRAGGVDVGWQVLHDSLFNIFSVGKCVLAILTHKLIAEGVLRLDAKIVEYWPEFGQHGKHELTVAHALGHRAGLCCPPSLSHSHRGTLASMNSASQHNWWHEVGNDPKALGSARLRPNPYSYAVKLVCYNKCAVG